jgi:potassium/hydrogen antiporter
VTPARLPPILVTAVIITVVLVFIARPLAVSLCLLPFRWPAREAAFIAWAGLRGGVPIYLSITRLLEGVPPGVRFDGIALCEKHCAELW